MGKKPVQGLFTLLSALFWWSWDDVCLLSNSSFVHFDPAPFQFSLLLSKPNQNVWTRLLRTPEPNPIVRLLFCLKATFSVPRFAVHGECTVNETGLKAPSFTQSFKLHVTRNMALGFIWKLYFRFYNSWYFSIFLMMFVVFKVNSTLFKTFYL